MKNSIKNIPGGKWWKVDFHVHTPASCDYGKGSGTPDIDKNVTPRDFLLNAIKKEVDCLVVSDHNSFDWIDKLREASKELEKEDKNITIFPAIEINVSGNIHLIAIFNIDIEVKELYQIFGKFCYDPKIESTTISISEVMEIVIKHKGIAIPAHVDGPSGLFYNNVATSIKSVLALDELLAFEVLGEKIDNQLLFESRRKISYVVGSDSHNLETLGSRYTWVKMGTPSIEAMRLALFDNTDGVLRDIDYENNPNDFRNRLFLREIEIKEASVAGRNKPLLLEFSPWLTSIIGGRGTGKSSIMQFIRIILNKGDELPETLKKEFDDFVNVSKNRSELGMLKENTEIRVVIVKDGVDYKFLWKNNQVYEYLGERLEQVSDISERFPIRLFNQKQLFEMTKDPHMLLKYIDDYWSSYSWKSEVDSIKNKYLDCMLRISKNNTRLNEKQSKEVRLREIENRINAFETDETRRILQSQKDLLSEEQQIKTFYKEYESFVSKYLTLYNEALNFDHIRHGGELLKKVDAKTQDQIKEWEKKLCAIVAQVKDIYEKNIEVFFSYDEWFKRLEISNSKNKNQKEIDDVITELERRGIDNIEEYPQLLSQKNELIKDIETYGDVDTIKKELEIERKSILSEFYDKIRIRKENRENIVKSWSESGDLRITLLPMANLEKNEEIFRNIINKQGNIFSSDILERGMEEEFTGGLIYKLGNSAENSFIDNYKNLISDLTNRDSTNFSKKFRNHLNNLFETDNNKENEINLWIPEDRVSLELKVKKGKYISIDAGSAGQRTSAILTLLLHVSEQPIFIDQPEDDLDTKNITDFIVKGINEKKRNQQIIVVTHNPNIVVNTNSEQVVHMDYAGGQINVSHSGALQDFDIRNAICDVMEGGRQALENRYYRITRALE